ncbi:nucleic-acid-binding protein from transposon X-element [Trichonephila clavipes]|nr:nucleic-acid-binding protein from transposon X-element [Trichonephila clavipes]
MELNTDYPMPTDSRTPSRPSTPTPTANQLLEYTRICNIAVSEFSSLPPCNLPGCPIHHTPHSTSSEISSQPDNINDNGIELVKNVPQKRKENDDVFITQPLSKADRPIKIVIKGLPRDTSLSNIQNELETLGFKLDRVSQLTGRITKQLLPIFLVTLPRNLFNSKIFDLNKLCYLSVRVDGYERVTKCFSCNKFNHTAENCHHKPRCLKGGLNHQTKECEIQRVDQMYCINCQVYGHTVNYAKYPQFPKPKKGANNSNFKNTYSNVVNSIVRPNVSYANATKNKTTINSHSPQQMATGNSGNSIGSLQSQANQVRIPPPLTQNQSNNPNINLMNQSIQGIIQALTSLTVQINNMSFATSSRQFNNRKNKSKEARKQQMYALVEVIFEHCDD